MRASGGSDLRPSIGAFGQSFMHTPHFDAFSKTAVRFTRAYSVAPHCLPSRNAYMTGRKPDTSQVWSGGGLMNFRTVGPDWDTLPSFFRDRGYVAVGQGKVFHEYGNKPAPHRPAAGWGRTDNQSWSPVGLPYFDPHPTGCPHASDTEARLQGQGKCMCATDQSGDDAIVANALHWLRTFTANRTQPFFLAVGLHRPHLPWSVPQEFFDLCKMRCSLCFALSVSLTRKYHDCRRRELARSGGA